ncbi:hypothetical protein D4764_20G0007320 [Takifugu flavidus]|uniref:Alkylated DNA repair protein AlkB homologue 8 N-terminal domain-containing protein n=1 Tax=Takifugu flavidus TaxID=433684 RepID=A0A5C6NKT8_9TELE|nr:hypothetical protein D4764_20G0007320 [Takifugu flavidus]
MVIGPIKDSKKAHLQRGGGSSEWCDTDNLLLNNEMTKELIVDFGRVADTHTPIHIKGTANIQQHLFYLRTLRKNHMSSAILVNFYRCTIESIMTNCITVWSILERRRGEEGRGGEGRGEERRGEERRGEERGRGGEGRGEERRV